MSQKSTKTTEENNIPQIIAFERGQIPEGFKYTGIGDVEWDRNLRTYCPLSEIINEENEKEVT